MTTHFVDQTLQAALGKAITTEFPGSYVDAVFSDVVMFSVYSDTSPDYKRHTYQVTWRASGDSYAFGEKTEVEMAYVTKRMDDERIAVAKQSAEGAGSIGGVWAFKRKGQHIAYAAVMVPGEPDSDGESHTTETIGRVMREYAKKYRNIDVMHSLNNIDADIIEIHQSTADMEVEQEGQPVVLPSGSWIQGVEFENDDDWEKVENGTYGGFSLMGVPRAVLDKAAVKSIAELDPEVFAANKQRVLIKDLGADWLVPFVSVVDKPAVGKAKWFAFKSAAEPETTPEPTSPAPTKPSLFERIFGNSASKSGRKFSDSTMERLRKAHEAAVGEADDLAALLKEAEEERAATKSNKEDEVDKTEVQELIDASLKSEAFQASITAAVTAAISPVTTELAAVKAAMVPPAKEPEPKEPKADEKPSKTEAELLAESEAEKEALKTRLAEFTTPSRALKAEDATPAGNTENGSHTYKDAFGRKWERDGSGIATQVS